MTAVKHLATLLLWDVGVTLLCAFMGLLQHGHLDLVLTLWNEGVKGHISCPAQSLSRQRGQAERNISSVRTSDREGLPPHSDGAAPEDKRKSLRTCVYVFDSGGKKNTLECLKEEFHVGRFVYLVQHGSGVCCRNTEASSGLCYRRGWKADYHYANFPLKHFSSESPGHQWKTETIITSQSHISHIFTRICSDPTSHLRMKKHLPQCVITLKVMRNFAPSSPSTSLIMW